MLSGQANQNFIPKNIFINQRSLIYTIDRLIHRNESNPIGEGLKELKEKVLSATSSRKFKEILEESQEMLLQYEEKLLTFNNHVSRNNSVIFRSRLYASINFKPQRSQVSPSIPKAQINSSLLSIIKELEAKYGEVVLIPKTLKSPSEFLPDAKNLFMDGNGIHLSSAIFIMEYAIALAYQLQTNRNESKSYELCLMHSLPKTKLAKASIITPQGLFQLDKKTQEYKCILDVEQLKTINFGECVAMAFRIGPHERISIKNQLSQEALEELDNALTENDGAPNDRFDEYTASEIEEVLREILDPILLQMPLEDESFFQQILNNVSNWNPQEELKEKFPAKYDEKTGFWNSPSDELYGNCAVLQNFLVPRLEFTRNARLSELEKFGVKIEKQNLNPSPPSIHQEDNNKDKVENVKSEGTQTPQEDNKDKVKSGKDERNLLLSLQTRANLWTTSRVAAKGDVKEKKNKTSHTRIIF